MPAFKRPLLDPLDETAAAVQPLITATGETRERVITSVHLPGRRRARTVSNAIGTAMSAARGHLNAAAKDGRIIRRRPACSAAGRPCRG
jgi:predicted ArsR family transcriptional regulator